LKEGCKVSYFLKQVFGEFVPAKKIKIKIKKIKKNKKFSK
jgi:hypothetical protein